MYALTCDIIIGNYRFKQVNKVHIERGIKRLVSTAVITLPNVKTFIGNPHELDKVITVGDPVTIKLGYDGNNNEEFTGYVSDKLPNVPFEIKCEDGMWPLRQKSITNAWNAISLKSLLKYLVPDMVMHASVWDITLENFRIDHANVVQVFEKLCEAYGLIIWWMDGRVHCSLPYYPLPSNKQVIYHFQKNVVKSNLLFRSGENYRLKVRAISMFPDNKKFEVSIGDTDGDETTLHFFRLQKDQLLAQANQKLKVLKNQGYRGNFTAFGLPFVQSADVAIFQDDFYPERSGANYIDDIVTDWGMQGFRRIITPGLKAQAANG